MTTVAVLATRALRRLQIVEPGVSPDAADQADAEQALNDMHGGWIAAGLTIPGLPLEARFDAGVVAMLAVRLAEEYGKTPGPVLLRDAERGESEVFAAFFAVPASRFDDGLISTGHEFDAGVLYGQSDENYSAWEADTAYVLREYVINGSNLYECTVAGTSDASGGPTGNSTAITDNTVTWTWRRVVG